MPNEIRHIIGLDAHSRVCESRTLDKNGRTLETKNFITSGNNLISLCKRFPSSVVVLEECAMAQWIVETLTPYASDVFVSDPKHNKWITSGMKSDRIDAEKLATLYRIGSLRRVYHGLDRSRVEFKRTVQNREMLVKERTRVKNAIKAKFREYGIVLTNRHSPYSKLTREDHLKLLPAGQFRMSQLYERLDMLERQEREAYCEIVKASKSFPEISRMIKVPGVGLLGASTLVGYMQIAERFAVKQQVCSYAGLKVMTKTSAGKRLRHPRLSRTGVMSLKSMSRHAFLGALNTRGGDNAIAEYYRRHVRSCATAHGARLSTQRKILTILWHIWKTGEEYDEKKV